MLQKKKPQTIFAYVNKKKTNDIENRRKRIDASHRNHETKNSLRLYIITFSV